MSKAIRIRLVAGLACVLLASAVPHASAQDRPCAEALSGLGAAISAGDPRRIVAAERIVDIESDCGTPERVRAKSRSAIAHADLAQRLRAGGVPARERLQLLEQARTLARPWQLMSAIGDTLQEISGPGGKPDYAAASLAYLEALNDLTDPVKEPDPPAAQFDRIRRLAMQTRALAGDFVPGEGLATRSLRGIKPEAFATPVQFEYDSDRMTALGQRYASEAAAILATESRPRILLVGHTDPVGSDAHNDALSLRRATAFKAALVQAGYAAAAIEIKGLGKRGRFVLEDRGRYSEAEVHQIMRRVEICYRDRKPTSDPGTNCQ